MTITPAALVLLASQTMKTVHGLIAAAELLQGEPLSDEQISTIMEDKQAQEERWAGLGPGQGPDEEPG